MEEQERIVNKYLAKLDEIMLLKMSLEKAKSELTSIFDKEC